MIEPVLLSLAPLVGSPLMLLRMTRQRNRDVRAHRRAVCERETIEMELDTGIITEEQAVFLFAQLPDSRKPRPVVVEQLPGQVVEHTSVWREWEERNRAELDLVDDRTPFDHPDMDVIAR